MDLPAISAETGGLEEPDDIECTEGNEGGGCIIFDGKPVDDATVDVVGAAFCIIGPLEGEDNISFVESILYVK